MRIKTPIIVYSCRPVLGNLSTFLGNLIRTFKSKLSCFVGNKSVIYSHLITYYMYTDYISPAGGTNTLLEPSTAGCDMIMIIITIDETL